MRPPRPEANCGAAASPQRGCESERRRPAAAAAAAAAATTAAAAAAAVTTAATNAALSPAIALGMAAVAVSSATFAQTTDHLLAPQQTVLNIVWEVAPSPTDRMSTIDVGEARRYPMLGPMYYVPSAPVAGGHPLYRVLSGAGDHGADLAPPPGYATEGTLGFLWPAKNRTAGSAPVWRIVDAKTGDHGLTPPPPATAPPSGANPNFAPMGYTPSPLPDAYAWPRYGKTPSLLALVGKQVTVTSNLAAGGALWTLEWNGQQFVDQLDYGRLIQSSLSFSGPGASKALPTEGGDQTADHDPSFLHGSPLLSATTAVTPQGKTQSTRAIPLEWLNTAYDGGHPGQAVAYPAWQLGKDITLDDTAVQLGDDKPQWSAQVMRYRTVFVNGGPPLPQADIEMPTAYLKAAFRRAFTCDATQTGASALQEVFGPQFEQLDAATWHYQYNVAAGGVILSNDGSTHALGIYGSTPGEGGTATYFTLWRFGDVVKPVVNKSSAAGGMRTFVTGANRFQSWLVVGSPTDVCNIMHRMYAHGLR